MSFLNNLLLKLRTGNWSRPPKLLLTAAADRPWGVRLNGVGSVNGFQNRWEMQGKEAEQTFGLNRVNFGARTYNPTIGRFDGIDLLAESFTSYFPFAFSDNNPLNMIDPDGNFAVSVHYNITYNALLLRGYTKKQADLIAHMSSTYADHPSEGFRALDHFVHNLGANGHLAHRKNSGINYNLTATSQDKKNSHWYSMMSDAEAAGGMTEEQAMNRGLKFGWDNIFAQKDGENLGKLGQGLHALQDAYAHFGVEL